jgi:hypothetical protein
MIVGIIFSSVVYIKNQEKKAIKIVELFQGEFSKKQSCGIAPRFLQQLNIRQPVIIDLSQNRFKGVAFHHGENMEQTLHSKAWEYYESFGTYTLDEQGNLYLAPMPHINTTPSTFELQKNIYYIDSATGKLAIFMHIDDVFPDSNNPYGIHTLVYDCEDKTLWIAAIDETNYQGQKGVIYHVDPKTKTILQRVNGFDAHTLNILQTTKAKYLLAGSAIDNALYAYQIIDGSLSSSPVKLLELTNSNDHIRKIKIKENNYLELQITPFSYALIVQTTKNYRTLYDAKWNSVVSEWTLSKRE